MIQKILCFFGKHTSVVSMELAYLHRQCKHCGRHLETIANIEKLIELGILEIE